ncbi:M20/M25/M40 family metallo-hydrolase [Bradyrhizobium sp. Arg237L]|uniref:M20/M25/M40 family metallo-hydrolase n=1 Tax=Bradyrhizobium sp. Arg237L TaxID=3003352 RepID=UPI00249ED77A|nr:M20/M25/M40 family metallo-hydrolase [Bradyrhizobium sp. Arg237L]MDI4238575.1 M20/M25/M40 family metallo-hydrolase [Bradyrhizobium sp. Arg237L]
MADLRTTLLGWIDQDQDNILQFMQTMVHTRSPNPPGDTREVMALVRYYLDSCGLAYAMVNRDGTMPNLVATQAFAAGPKHLVLNGHIDVFPVETSEGWSQDPWDGHVDGTIWGRGSADMKVGTTASILTYVYLSRLAQHFAGKLTLTVVSEEESFGPNGARHLFDACPELITGTALLNGEPSGASVVRFGEKGALWLRITVQTPGGHGAYPHLSPNAIEKALELIIDLKTLAQVDFQEPDVVVAALERSRADYDRAYGEGASDLARKVTMNIGTISGGSRVNMIASRCTFDVDIRLPNGADADDMLARIEVLRDRHQFTYEVLLLNRPNWADPNDELALIVADTADAVTGIRPVPAVSLGNTDARLWRYRNVPSVVYGPSPRGMGSTNEHVPIAEALNVVRCHVLSAAAYLLQKA